MDDKTYIFIAYREEYEDYESRTRLLVGAFRGQLRAENALTEHGRWTMRERDDYDARNNRWAWMGWIQDKQYIGWIEKVELR